MCFFFTEKKEGEGREEKKKRNEGMKRKTERSSREESQDGCSVYTRGGKGGLAKKEAERKRDKERGRHISTLTLWAVVFSQPQTLQREDKQTYKSIALGEPAERDERHVQLIEEGQIEST